MSSAEPERRTAISAPSKPSWTCRQPLMPDARCATPSKQRSHRKYVATNGGGDRFGINLTLRVKQGKGGKDRYAILSQNLLVELRQYWKRYRPSIWLFPNRTKNGPLSR